MQTETSAQPLLKNRYEDSTKEKSEGATYTPAIFADFVAEKIVNNTRILSTNKTLRVLDPAIGDGELLLHLIGRLLQQDGVKLEVYGFETNEIALNSAKNRIKQAFPDVQLNFKLHNFLEFVLEHYGCDENPEKYDLIIANPPYVRTQIMGSEQAQMLADQFGLSGRVDLYHPFILGMARILNPCGIAGIIVSNRFMTTKSGASVRKALLTQFNIKHIWDLGDTKLFDAAVLPAVLLLEGKNGHKLETPKFTSIYQTTKKATTITVDPIDALSKDGVVAIEDGRCFDIQHGELNTSDTIDGVWRISTKEVDTWLSIVKDNSWGTFRDIGKVRVGVKTCADKVFIRSDWGEMQEKERPELIKTLITHHIARRFKVLPDKPKKILYPQEVRQGNRCAIDLSEYPKSRAYLEKHRNILEKRKYVIEAGREWYEIWVPQDPETWKQPKLVFRDIAEEPIFWIDLDGSIVNGDCYWLICKDSSQTDLLWLAVAVGNSTFIERFYDYSFNNKLYAGRRRFITQYVEQFPVPDPQTTIGQAIITKAKYIYDNVSSPDINKHQKELDHMIWDAFGLVFEKV